MATFVRFNQFTEDVAAGVHVNSLNADTDVWRVYLTNTAPDASADGVKADLAEIATGNGYTGAVDIQQAATQTGTTITVTAVDVTITATGSVGPFRYAVIYNDTPTSPADPLIGYYDYGSSISLSDTQQFVVDFGASLLAVG